VVAEVGGVLEEGRVDDRGQTVQTWMSGWSSTSILSDSEKPRTANLLVA
jgi:hypothetical protein